MVSWVDQQDLCEEGTFFGFRNELHRIPWSWSWTYLTACSLQSHEWIHQSSWRRLPSILIRAVQEETRTQLWRGRRTSSPTESLPTECSLHQHRQSRLVALQDETEQTRRSNREWIKNWNHSHGTDLLALGWRVTRTTWSSLQQRFQRWSPFPPQRIDQEQPSHSWFHRLADHGCCDTSERSRHLWFVLVLRHYGSHRGRLFCQGTPLELTSALIGKHRFCFLLQHGTAVKLSEQGRLERLDTDSVWSWRVRDRFDRLLVGFR